MSSKAIKATLAAIGPRQAVVVGKEAPASTPKGAIVLQFGKTFALQREATNVVESLPGKLPAATKALVESGGVVTAKVAKAAGIDFAALSAKLTANKAVTVNVSATKLIVTPRAKRADLLPLGGEAPAAKPATKVTKAPAKPAAKTKAAPAKEAKPTKAEKKAKEAPKASKATKVAAKPAKAAPVASKASQKAPAKSKAAPAPAKGKGKGKEAKAPAKVAAAKTAKPAKVEKTEKAKQGQKNRPSKG